MNKFKELRQGFKKKPVRLFAKADRKTLPKT
jgi:hypothetical protein